MNELIRSRALIGLEAHEVVVECNISAGLPRTTIVGLAESAVRESRDRVAAAIQNSGFYYPDGAITINLAPGTLAKSSSALDLPIALSILAATRQLNTKTLAAYEWLGELALSGSVRPVVGALACAQAAALAQRIPILPDDAGSELGWFDKGEVGVVASLLEAATVLNEGSYRTPTCTAPSLGTTPSIYSDIIGQRAAKQALQVAAAGGHHFLMVGPPGGGKTMLARALAELLPPMTHAQQIEVATIYSCSGLPCPRGRPFREPHHSASSPALLGGGRIPQPGDAVLAHHGVLFLDELPHFKPSVLDHLREPLEAGKTMISRANYKVHYPCSFQLVAAMNPCPAGRTCNESACRCAPGQVRRYQARISGPMVDRIDLQVMVPEVPPALLTQALEAPSDIQCLKQTIERAYSSQILRQGKANARLDAGRIHTEIRNTRIGPSLQRTLEKRVQSARSLHKVWKVARTIADLDDARHIGEAHVIKALSFRTINWEDGLEVGLR